MSINRKVETHQLWKCGQAFLLIISANNYRLESTYPDTHGHQHFVAHLLLRRRGMLLKNQEFCTFCLEEKSVRHWNRFFVVGTGRKKMKERKVGISYGMKTKRCDYGGLRFMLATGYNQSNVDKLKTFIEKLA
ncbi:hypothetical protein P5673_017053 [Acropora cervicornis]|uniref:Uncharacterized protein n=1 Tax=Acropora cervicornis TaxID=6130 RepID=A0AAD9QFA6_ACRCE|nr:hypothetical protein P5673_017053 [Acropora cervicornis]